MMFQQIKQFSQHINDLVFLLRHSNIHLKYKKRIKEYRKLLINCLNISEKDTLAILMNHFDNQSGNGYRNLFKITIKYLAVNRPSLARKFINFIIDNSRLDTLEYFYDTPLHNEVVSIIVRLLKSDYNKILQKDVKNLSLMAKWLTKSHNARYYNAIVKQFYNIEKTNIEYKNQFRKMITLIRSHLNLFENDIRLKKFNGDHLTSKHHTYYRSLLNDNGIFAKEYSEYLKNNINKVNTKHFNEDNSILTLQLFDVFYRNSDWMRENFYVEPISLEGFLKEVYNKINENEKLKNYFLVLNEKFKRDISQLKVQKNTNEISIIDLSGSIYVDNFNYAFYRMALLNYQYQIDTVIGFSDTSFTYKYDYNNLDLTKQLLTLIYYSFRYKQWRGTNFKSAVKMVNELKDKKEFFVFTDACFNVFSEKDTELNQLFNLFKNSKHQFVIWDFEMTSKYQLLPLEIDNVLYFTGKNNMIFNFISDQNTPTEIIQILKEKYKKYL